ncbi:hypothetical protein D3C78_1682020 [compost metagenome]
MVHQIVFFVVQHKVFTPERHDLHPGLIAGQGGDAVTEKTGAVNQPLALIFCARGTHADAVTAFNDALNLLSIVDLAAALLDHFRQLCRHLAVVDDTGIGHQQCLNTVDVRLTLL